MGGGGGGGGPEGSGREGFWRFIMGWCSGGGSGGGEYEPSRESNSCGGGGVASCSADESEVPVPDPVKSPHCPPRSDCCLYTVLQAVAIHLRLQIRHLPVDFVENAR